MYSQFFPSQSLSYLLATLFVRTSPPSPPSPIVNMLLHLIRFFIWPYGLLWMEFVYYTASRMCIHKATVCRATQSSQIETNHSLCLFSAGFLPFLSTYISCTLFTGNCQRIRMTLIHIALREFCRMNLRHVLLCLCSSFLAVFSPVALHLNEDRF